MTEALAPSQLQVDVLRFTLRKRHGRQPEGQMFWRCVLFSLRFIYSLYTCMFVYFSGLYRIRQRVTSVEKWLCLQYQVHARIHALLWTMVDRFLGWDEAQIGLMCQTGARIEWRLHAGLQKTEPRSLDHSKSSNNPNIIKCVYRSVVLFWYLIHVIFVSYG